MNFPYMKLIILTLINLCGCGIIRHIGKRDFKLAASRSANDNKMKSGLNGYPLQFIKKGMKYNHKNSSLLFSQLEEKRNTLESDGRHRNFSTGIYFDNKISPPMLNYSEETMLTLNSSGLWNFSETAYDSLEYDNLSEIDSYYHLLHEVEYFLLNDTDIIDIINKTDARVKHKEPTCNLGDGNCTRCQHFSPFCHYMHSEGRCMYFNTTHASKAYECGKRWYPLDTNGLFFATAAILLIISLSAVGYLIWVRLQNIGKVDDNGDVTEAVDEEYLEMRKQVEMIRLKRLQGKRVDRTHMEEQLELLHKSKSNIF